MSTTNFKLYQTIRVLNLFLVIQILYQYLFLFCSILTQNSWRYKGNEKLKSTPTVSNRLSTKIHQQNILKRKQAISVNLKNGQGSFPKTQNTF